MAFALHASTCSQPSNPRIRSRVSFKIAPTCTTLNQIPNKIPNESPKIEKKMLGLPWDDIKCQKVLLILNNEFRKSGFLF